MAASENVLLLPRLSLGGANHFISLSSQMVKLPQAFNYALYAFHFMVWNCLRPQLDSLIRRAYCRSDLGLCNNAQQCPTWPPHLRSTPVFPAQ